jgi:hypothetical protein
LRLTTGNGKVRQIVHLTFECDPRSVSFKRVIVGAIVDVAGTYIALFGVLAYLIIRRQLYALPPAWEVRRLVFSAAI